MFHTIRRTALITIVFVSAVGSRTYGQSAPLAVFTGTLNPAPLGTAYFSPAGDWNADGVPDYAGLRQLDTLSSPQHRYEGIEIFDGATIATLAYFPLPSVTDRRLDSAGDWNSDGRHEFLVWEGRFLRIHDLISGQVLATFTIPVASSGYWSFYLGSYCFAEVTGDLTPDLCAVAYVDNSQNLAVFSGASGQLHRFDPLGPSSYEILGSLPDRNSDGNNELAFLRRQSNQTLNMRILDGAGGWVLVDGPALSLFSQSVAWNYLSYSSSLLSQDLNGDAVPDVMILYGSAYATNLLLLSGADGSSLWEVPSVPVPMGYLPYSQNPPASMITDDHDGDARPDVLVVSTGSPMESGGSVPPYSWIHSSADGQVIQASILPYGQTIESIIRPTVDRDSDGKRDFIAVENHELSIRSSSTGLTISRRVRRLGSEQLGKFTYLADWDQDGIKDLFVSSPGSATGGTIDIYSGVDRMLLATWNAPVPLRSFGSTVLQLPDQDSDGMPDYAIAAPEDHSDGAFEGGLVFFVSGATGSVLWQLQGAELKSDLGRAMLLIPDLDGDGKVDLVVSAPSRLTIGGYTNPLIAAGTPALHFVSLGTRQILRTAVLAGTSGGTVLRLADDLDMDGFPDVFAFQDFDSSLAFGCFEWPYICPWGPFFAIVSSATGLTIRGPSTIAPFAESGYVCFVDVDGDGRDEVITYTGCGWFWCGPGFACHSTFDGSLKWTMPYSFAVADNWQLLGIRDLTGDGRDDWAAVDSFDSAILFGGSPPVGLGSRSGALPRISKRHQVTWSDQNADGYPEIVVPSWGPNPLENSFVGEIRILSGADNSSLTTLYGSGSPGGGGLEPKLRVLGHPPAVGEATFAIGLSHAAANAAVVLGISSALNPSPISLLGASFYLDFTAPSLLLDSVFRVPTPTAVNPTGVLRIPLPIPNSAAWHGLTLHFQAAVVDPNAANGIFSTTPVLSVSIP